MRILIVGDSSRGLSLSSQLKKMSEDTGIPLLTLLDVRNKKNDTSTYNIQRLKFMPEEPYIEKPLSYKAQQKKLPKFLRKK